MLRLAPLAFLEGVKCKCWNEAVDFLAITLLGRRVLFLDQLKRNWLLKLEEEKRSRRDNW